MNNSTQSEVEIRAFFDEFVNAYPKDDIQRYLDLFLQDETLVMFGTGEKWLGWENYKGAPAEDKARHGEISLSYDWLEVNYHGPVAWIAAEVKVNVKIESEWKGIPARLTGVLKKIGENWKIAQGHISIPS